MTDVAEVRTQMAERVSFYEERYNAMKTAYEQKEATLATINVHDRAALMPAREDVKVAKSNMDLALQDLEEARKYADREIAKAEKAADKEQKEQALAAAGAERSPGKAAVGTALAAGGVTLAAGAGVLCLAGKGVKKLANNGVNAIKNSKMVARETGSQLMMAFAKYVMGYNGRDLPTDPTRHVWANQGKKGKNGQSGYHCHDEACHPSLV